MLRRHDEGVGLVTAGTTLLRRSAPSCPIVAGPLLVARASQAVARLALLMRQHHQGFALAIAAARRLHARR
jgi:hypothetical protein